MQKLNNPDLPIATNMRSYHLVVPSPELSGNPVIELVYPDGTTKTYLVGTTVRGTKHQGQRPIDIKWHNCSNIQITDSIKRWIYQELKYVFTPTCFNSVIPTLLESVPHE